jgi:hypothetical protein
MVAGGSQALTNTAGAAYDIVTLRFPAGVTPTGTAPAAPSQLTASDAGRTVHQTPIGYAPSTTPAHHRSPAPPRPGPTRPEPSPTRVGHRPTAALGPRSASPRRIIRSNQGDIS